VQEEQAWAISALAHEDFEGAVECRGVYGDTVLLKSRKVCGHGRR
jgi:hypothetical protein